MISRLSKSLSRASLLSQVSLWTLLAACVLPAAGCRLIIPEVTYRPVIRNPFPQLSRVAVAPFFNQSDEPTVDGRQFAMAYFAELQATPGFEVVPVTVVEEAMIQHRIDLSGPGEARRLAKILGVDAVAVGSVTDFSAYYPPRCGLKVEWYSADVGFHEIPAGYGLPWNTPEEEFIPDSLVYEAQLAQARSEMTAQPSACNTQIKVLPPPPEVSTDSGFGTQQAGFQSVRLAQAVEEVAPGDQAGDISDRDVFEEPAFAGAEDASEALPLPSSDSTEASEMLAPAPDEPLLLPGAMNGTNDTTGTIVMTPHSGAILNGCQQQELFECVPHHGPVLNHTKIYRGNDPEITEALKGYVYFQDDARFGGWEGYLQRSDDFVRFCCHLHISEMLSARGGSRKTSMVWRWPDVR
ncbi:hypothetical protein [Adhaeretor mobilis]|uniref:Lipoprotein n=1 Tax=Adhaeretor mobilis TaxID=1930276 RepID=A0A517MT22_9BACT|nr:hypothetical protein [Adhaeretor mobilis]QDS98033.1 hypothetical protein HG15A2_13030 [Adhaeretor mobilis]